jgi:2-oxoglutarate ferredoxin oxidoreductase subunit delta
MTPMDTIKKTIMKDVPQFSSSRCKRCGICSHFCPVRVIDTCDGGMPFLADAVACTSCGLCRDMCPDWAVSLEPAAVEVPEEKKSSKRATEPPAEETAAEAPTETEAEPSGNGAGSLEAVPASGD